MSFRRRRGREAATVTSWSPTRIEVSVPAGAINGPVLVDTSEGEELVPGLVAISGAANGVDRLAVAGRSRASADGVKRLRIRATDAAGRAMAGATVALLGGGSTKRARSDRRGLATFRVSGYGSQQFIAHLGDRERAIRCAVGARAEMAHVGLRKAGEELTGATVVDYLGANYEWPRQGGCASARHLRPARLARQRSQRQPRIH